MKHIFWIHSHITFLLTKSIITELNLKKKDILILTYRNYKMPSDFTFFCDLYNIKREDIWGKERKAFQKKWSKIFRTKFILYVPQSQEVKINLLINLKKCIGYNYMEEGLLSYRTEQTNTIKIPYIKQKIANLFGNNTLSDSFLDFYHIKYKKSFCISDLAFPNAPNRIVLKEAFHENSKPLEIQDLNVVLVFDALVSYKILEIEELKRLLIDVITPHLKERYKIVHYKLHIEQLRPENEEELYLIKEIFSQEKAIEFIELPQETVLEELLLSDTKIAVYNFVSSIGFYGYLFGNKVYSVSNRLPNTVKLDAFITEKWNQI